MTDKMTWAEAREVARGLAAHMRATDGLYGMSTVYAFLPRDWTLKPDACSHDFWPWTVEHIAEALREWAVPVED